MTMDSDRSTQEQFSSSCPFFYREKHHHDVFLTSAGTSGGNIRPWHIRNVQEILHRCMLENSFPSYTRARNTREPLLVGKSFPAEKLNKSDDVGMLADVLVDVKSNPAETPHAGEKAILALHGGKQIDILNDP